MDRDKIKKYFIFSIIFIFILGTLLHFTYKLSGSNKILALFSAVNESVWEHLKLLYFPMLISIIAGYFYLGTNIPNFLCSKTIGILISMAFIIIFFYTYTGVLGRSIAAIDIASFFIATVLGEFLAYLLIMNKFKCNKIVAILVLAVLFVYFIIFTYSTPNIGIFKDPVTGEYGIENKI